MDFELTENEQIFILLLRSFSFLRNEGYEVDDFSLSGLCSYISFKKKWSRLRIYIEWAPMINYHAEFIQQHLMPIIRGEMWIDEFSKNKRKKNPTKETDSVNHRFTEQWRNGNVNH